MPLDAHAMGHATIRVLHIQKVAGIAGSENHLLTLLPHLRRYDVQPMMLVLADRQDRPREFVERMQAAGVTTRVVPMLGDVDPTLVPRLVRHVHRSRCAIVHTHLFHADIYGRLAARLARVPAVVSSLHSDGLFRRSRLVRLLTRESVRQSNSIICISEGVRRFATEIGGLPDTKMKVVHYGLMPVNPARDGSWRCQMGWSDETPVIGIVARLIPAKGHSTLLLAMSEVVRRVPDAQLVVVGSGELHDDLVAQVNHLGLVRHVHFLGYRSDAAAIMANFDLFVLPSRWEGFGLVLLEAMDAGLPIVATTVPAIQEIVRHEETGLLTPIDDGPALADAIATLLTDRERARAMGEAGRHRLFQHFSVEAMVSQTADIYRSLIPSHPSPCSQEDPRPHSVHAAVGSRLP